jgi:hypothetical protein
MAQAVCVEPLLRAQGRLLSPEFPISANAPLPET